MNQDLVLTTLINQLKTLTIKPSSILWVGFSGGIDSRVLLDGLYQLRHDYSLTIKAIHINHGLSVHARQWQAQCVRWCEAYGIECVVESLQLQLHSGESVEAVLRQARYQCFQTRLNRGDVLLTAHQQNDQAETLLLQLLRGAGLPGLAAMPPIKPLGCGYHLRPFLTLSRMDLQQYALAHQLDWIEDESNLDQRWQRNFIRQQVLPLLNSRWPQAITTLARSAAHCAEADRLLEQYGQSELEKIMGTMPNTLSVKGLIDYPLIDQRHLLRLWISQQGYPLPPTHKLIQIQQELLTARDDAQPCISWGEVSLRRYRHHLYLLPRQCSAVPVAQPWDLQLPLNLPGLGTLTAQPTLGQGIRLDSSIVTVAFRQGGERCRLPGHTITHELKKIWQTLGLPPWQRPYIPLILVDGKIAAAVGYFVTADFYVKPEEMGIVINHSREGMNKQGGFNS